MKFQIPNFKSQIENGNFWIFLILIFAAFLRLYRIQDYMTFLGDEGRDVLVVYNILHGKLTLLGPTASVGGFFLGPIYYYFMAPFLWLFNYNPVGPAIMVALFGIATVYLTYKFSEEFFNKRVAIIASFIYAIPPLIIAYSRSSWNPNIFPFFSILSVYFLYKAVKNNSSKLFVLTGILLGISIQLHYLALFLGAVIFSYLLVINLIRARLVSFKNSIWNLVKENLSIFAGFLLGVFPFLAFEGRHGFPNTRSILNFILNAGDTGFGGKFLDNISNVFFRLFGRLVTNFPPPEQVAVRAHLDMAVWYYLTLFLAIVSVLILLYKFVQVYKSLGKIKESLRFYQLLLLIIWLVVGIGLFGFYKKPIYDYYLGFMFPLPFILSAVAFDFFIFNKKNIFKIAGIAGLIAVVYINLTGVPFRHEPNRQLAQVKKISEFVLEKTDDKPFNFALITGGNSDHAYRYFFTLENKFPVIIQNSQVDPQRESVTDQLLIVCEINPCSPLGHPLWEVAGFGRAEIVGEWTVSVVKVYKLVRYKGQ